MRRLPTSSIFGVVTNLGSGLRMRTTARGDRGAAAGDGADRRAQQIAWRIPARRSPCATPGAANSASLPLSSRWPPRQPPSQRSTRARGARRALTRLALLKWLLKLAALLIRSGADTTPPRRASGLRRLPPLACGTLGERLTMALGRSVLRTDRLAPAADVVDFWCCYESRIGAEDADDGARRPRRGRG